MEKYQTFQTLCQLGLAIFSMLAILCGYGAYHFSVKKENAKVESQRVVNNQGQTDLTHKSDIYHIAGDLVKGDKVSKTKQEEIYAPSALIVTKDQSGGQNIVNFSQNEYKAINKDLKEEIKEKLDKLILKYPNPPKIVIEIESGNSQRNKVALEIEELFAKNNLGIYPKGNTFIGRFPEFPISVFINPANKNFANELIDALKSYILGEFKIIEDNATQTNFIRVYINGEPLFDSTGKVRIQ